MLSDRGQWLFSNFSVYLTVHRFSREMGLTMQTIAIQEYAQQLLETHGGNAVVVAAEKARSFEDGGNKVEAETWRKIEAALKLMRGPRES
jgi:hypothetical protein